MKNLFALFLKEQVNYDPPGGEKKNRKIKKGD